VSVFIFLELEGLGLGLELRGIGCRLPVPDTRLWTVVWIPTPAPPSAKMKTLSIAVRLLSYDAAVFFFRINVDVIIVF